MKKFLFLFFALCSSYSFGQNGNFNTLRVYYGAVFGSQLRDPSAMVDIQGTTGGFLCPRLTTTERNAIPSPATGLMIYNTSTGAFNWYNGSGWSVVGTGGGTVTSVSGTANRITSTGGATPVIDISASYVGQSSITTLGTVTTGTWNGSVLGVAYGGTNISSYAIGDIIYASGATTLSKLPIGTANQQLRVNAGATALEYFTPAASGITVGTTTITGGTTGRIPYNNAGVYGEKANFTIDLVGTGILDVPVAYAARGVTILSTSSSANGYRGTYLGYRAAESVTADNVTALGYGTNRSGTGTDVISIGAAVNYNGQNYNYSLFIGSSGNNSSGMQNTAANQVCIGMPNGGGYKDWYFGQGPTPQSTTYDITWYTTPKSGTNGNGNDWIFIPTLGTGTGASGNHKIKTGVKTSSGTTQQTATDRFVAVGKYVDITGGAATVFGNLALATSGTVAGGTVIYTIEANDGTDYQALSGVLKYDVVNKAGTLTVVYEDDQNSACACSAGTLTATVTAAVSGTNLLFQSDAVSSLSETTLRVSFQVLNNFGQAVITPN